MKGPARAGRARNCRSNRCKASFMTRDRKLLAPDSRGRVERREALLGEFGRSGLSGVKCTQMGGKYPTAVAPKLANAGLIVASLQLWLA